MSTIIKRKTTMLLHQIEEALGNFVLNNGDVESLNIDKLDNIHRREVDKGRVFNRNSIKDVVEATYLDELFGFALDIAQDSSLVDSINYLYSLFHHLDIYEIRNAISHPNRSFWDCYWYRVAAVASDPVNEILGLTEIKQALELIEKGIINDPPEDWVSKIIWQIPNNLPDHFDHGVTGLIGRTKELSDLKKYISNPRINTISLVAPGGAGKTALALDFLNTIVSTPSFSKILDSVVFITMKTEKLTANGVVSLDSIQTLDELKENIRESLNTLYDRQYETFEETLENLNNQKVLLCLDNLETLLREKHQSFEEFNNELPPCWQVLITSRIVIPNATILSLDALKEKSAAHLARTYSLKRGMPPLAEDAYLQLTKGCFYNPLAIRLTIDLLLTGKDIPSSLNVANKEIAEFSYNNLINVLSENAIAILEAIFVEDISTRLSLCELLNKSIDEISSAIGELSRTSLISRASSDEGESYKLSDSVRDLLLISPKNITIRSTVQELILKRRNLSNEIDIRQNVKDIPIWHTDYIPNDSNQNLKILVTQVNSGLRKNNRSAEVGVNLFRQLKDAQHIYEKSDLYHRSFGRVYELLKDYNSAEDAYTKAISCNADSPIAYYLLARLYHSTNQFDKARDTYQILIDKGYTKNDEAIISFGKSIYTGYCLALLYSGKYDEVFELTENWKENSPYRCILGTFRAGAWKRKAESEDDPKQKLESLFRGSQILSDIFRTEGYARVTSTQAIKIFEEIEYCLARPIHYSTEPDRCNSLLKFVFNNIFEIDQLDKNSSLLPLITRFIELNIPNNIFKDNIGTKNDYVINDDECFKDCISVNITNRPKDRSSFLFAQDSNGQDFFLHYDNLENGTWKDWNQLSLNQSLYVKYSGTAEPNRAIKVDKIYLPS